MPIEILLKSPIEEMKVRDFFPIVYNDDKTPLLFKYTSKVSEYEGIKKELSDAYHAFASEHSLLF